MKKALILVDVQNDFCNGGKLAVPDGDAVVSVANRMQSCFDWVIATKDWHPPGHISFITTHTGHKVGDIVIIDTLQQELWPEHCIQNSPGAEFHPELNDHKIQKVIYKGVNQAIDSYSAFFDNAHRRSTGLAEHLQQEGVPEVYIMGLATDYCVKYSCQDAVRLGLKVHVIEDGCRGVELNPGDVARAIETLQMAGVDVVKSDSISLSQRA